MNSKVLEIYGLLKNRDYFRACDLAQSLYSSQQGNKSFEIIKVLAISYMLKPDTYLAYIYFKEAYEIKKDDFETITNLAGCSFEMQDFQLSFDMANKSIAMDPNKHMAYITMSKLYLTTKELALAEKNILKAINLLGGDLSKIYSGHSDLFTLYLDILTAMNENQKIIDICKLVMKSEIHNMATILHYLNRIDKSTITKEYIARAENQINILEHNADTNKSLILKAHLNFCLGDYYIKDKPDLSDQFFIKGNSIIASLQRFKPLDHQKRCIETLKNFIQIKDLRISNSKKGKGIIFITGLPRSGTTLAESIIASNDDTCAGGELDILRYSVPKDFFIKPSLEKIEEIGDTYISRINFLRKDKKYFIDKLPQNFELIGLISVCLPGAKIINMQRNIWDIAISQFQQFYISNIPYTSSFFSMGITAANYEYMLDFYEKIIDQNILQQIKYEELVLNQNSMISQIYDFCEINSDYNPQNRLSHISKTASSSQVKQDIHQKSLNKTNFAEEKGKFWDAYEMQKSFWSSKSIEY